MALGPAACASATIVAVAVPSRHLAAPWPRARPACEPDAVLVSLAKGLDPATGRRLSRVLAAHVGGDPARVAALSGPNHAEEIARGTPAATVVASTSPELCRRLQAAFSTPRFRVYANTDLVGVELCAAAKNVIAIAAGASDGLGYGDNAKAALMTRGLAEMARLGAAFGADPRTFAGLAGLGDLVATCCSEHCAQPARRAAAGPRRAARRRSRRASGWSPRALVTAPTLLRIGRERGARPAADGARVRRARRRADRRGRRAPAGARDRRRVLAVDVRLADGNRRRVAATVGEARLAKDHASLRAA